MSSSICRPKPLIVEEENYSIGEYSRTSICKMGSGAAAHVISVEHRRTNTRYALKSVPIDRVQEVDELFNEAMLLQLVMHPNVIKMYQLMQTNRGLYLVLELLKTNLNQYINDHHASAKEKERDRELNENINSSNANNNINNINNNNTSSNINNFNSNFFASKEFDDNWFGETNMGGNTNGRRERTGSRSNLSKGRGGGGGGAAGGNNNNNNNNNDNDACGGLPESVARRLFQQVVAAVHCVHGHHITHNDIRCENIVTDYLGNARLIDFGRAIKFDPETNDIMHFAGGMSDDSMSLQGVHHSVNASLKEHPLWSHQHHSHPSNSNLASAAHSVRGGGHPYKPVTTNHTVVRDNKNNNNNNNEVTSNPGDMGNNNNNNRERLPVITASNLQQHQKGLTKSTSQIIKDYNNNNNPNNNNNNNATLGTTKAAFGRHQSIDQLSSVADTSSQSGGVAGGKDKDTTSTTNNNNNNNTTTLNGANANTAQVVVVPGTATPNPNQQQQQQQQQQQHRDPFSSALAESNTTSVERNNSNKFGESTPVMIPGGTSTSSAKNGATPSSNFGATALPTTGGPTPTNNNNNNNSNVTNINISSSTNNNNNNNTTAAPMGPNISVGNLGNATSTISNNFREDDAGAQSATLPFSALSTANRKGSISINPPSTISQANTNNPQKKQPQLPGGDQTTSATGSPTSVFASPHNPLALGVNNNNNNNTNNGGGGVASVSQPHLNPESMSVANTAQVSRSPDHLEEIDLFSDAAQRDVFDLGVVLYIILTGENPFTEYEDAEEVVNRSDFGSQIQSAAARQLVRGLINFDPTRQYTLGDVCHHPWFLVDLDLEKERILFPDGGIPRASGLVDYNSEMGEAQLSMSFQDKMSSPLPGMRRVNSAIMMTHADSMHHVASAMLSSASQNHFHGDDPQHYYNNNNNHAQPIGRLPRSSSALNVYNNHHGHDNDGESFTSTPRERAVSIVATSGVRGFLDFSSHTKTTPPPQDELPNNNSNVNNNNYNNPLRPAPSFVLGQGANGPVKNDKVGQYQQQGRHGSFTNVDANAFNASNQPLFTLAHDDMESSQKEDPNSNYYYHDRKSSLSHQNMILHNQYHAAVASSNNHQNNNNNINNNNTSTVNGMESLLAANKKSTEEERIVIQEAFQTIDVDANGYLSMDQIRDVIIALKRGDHVSKADVAGIYNELLSPSKRSHKTFDSNVSNSGATTNYNQNQISSSGEAHTINSHNNALSIQGNASGDSSSSPERQHSTVSGEFHLSQQNPHNNNSNNNNNYQQPHHSTGSAGFKQTTTKDFHGKNQNANHATANTATMPDANDPLSAESSPVKSDRHHSTSFARNHGGNTSTSQHDFVDRNTINPSPVPSPATTQNSQGNNNNNNSNLNGPATPQPHPPTTTAESQQQHQQDEPLTYRQFLDYWVLRDGDHDEVIASLIGPNTFTLRKLYELGLGLNFGSSAGSANGSAEGNYNNNNNSDGGGNISHGHGSNNTNNNKDVAVIASTLAMMASSLSLGALVEKSNGRHVGDGAGSSPQRDPTEIQKLRKAFDLLDKNHKGSFSQEDLYQFLHSAAENQQQNNNNNNNIDANKKDNTSPIAYFDIELLGDDDVARLAEALASRFHNKNICFFDFVAAILDDQVLTTNVLGSALATALDLEKIEHGHTDQALQGTTGITLLGTPQDIAEHLKKCNNLRVSTAGDFSTSQTPVIGFLNNPSSAQQQQQNVPMTPATPAFASPFVVKPLPPFPHNKNGPASGDSLNNTGASTFASPAIGNLVSPAISASSVFPKDGTNNNNNNYEKYQSQQLISVSSVSAVANSPTEVRIIVRYAKNGFPQTPPPGPVMPNLQPTAMQQQQQQQPLPPIISIEGDNMIPTTTSASASPMVQSLPPGSTHTAPSFAAYNASTTTTANPATPSTAAEGPIPAFPVTHANAKPHGVGNTNSSFRLSTTGAKSKLNAIKAKGNGADVNGTINGGEASPSSAIGVPPGMIDLKIVLRQADCRMMTTIQIRPLPGVASATYYSAHQNLWKDAVAYVREKVADLKLEALKMSRPSGDSEWI